MRARVGVRGCACAGASVDARASQSPERSAYQCNAGHEGEVISPISCDADSNRPEMRRPSSPAAENSPWATEIDRGAASSVSLSGVVFELVAGGLVPINGAELYCDSCGPEGRTWSYTDRDGRYTFPELFYRGYTTLLIRKDGYGLNVPKPSGPYDVIDVTVNGHTQLDVELVRR